MLNLGDNRIENKLHTEELKSLQMLSTNSARKLAKKIGIWALVIVLIVAVLPWTQNISGSGAVTTLKPDQRPQTIHSAIGGRIEKWYVKEGDFVKKGDTILFISEIKEDYFDPNLVQNTQNQMMAKKGFLSKAIGNNSITLIDWVKLTKKT